MALQIGIVGLPNVGKSTLFNALLRQKKAQAANYPFCTIDPNVGVVMVPDERLKKLAEMVHPEKTIPAAVEFVDIAGLVKGASKGEGLGNQFLANIRECNAIAEVVRVFEDPDVIHVHESVDPKRDIEIIHTELLLADLQTLEKRLSKARSEARSVLPKAIAYAELLKRVDVLLNAGKWIADGNFSDEELNQLQDLHLLTQKKVLYIANVHENELSKLTPEFLHGHMGLGKEAEIIPISAKVEEELSELSEEEAEEFLKELGIKEGGLSALIHAAYRTLGLQTYFTAGPKEVRAWTIKKGDKAPQAAGVIHSDFEKGFISVEVISYDDYITCNGVEGAKEKGKMRVEGKEYVFHEGDVVHFRFNV